MIIGGKCGLVKEHMLDRKQRGSDYLEIHTDYYDFQDGYKEKINDMRKFMKSEDIKSYCVHAPMNNASKKLLMSEPNKQIVAENRDLLKKTVECAIEICDYHSPIIVVHPSYELSINDEYDVNKMNVYNERFIEEIHFISEFVKQNTPNVRIGVENTSPVTISKKTKDLVVHAGFVYPDFANDVKKLNLSNVGVVLDTCHAFANIRLHNLLHRNINPISITDYLESSIDNLELVHLNNLSHLGEKTENHSTPFSINGENYRELETIFKFLIEHKYKNPITLEVLESDYRYGKNHTKIFDTCKNVLNNIE